MADVKPERIHGIQRIPHKRARGYCNVNPYSERARQMGRPGPGDPGWRREWDEIPEADRCLECKGKRLVPDEEVNRHRTHFMRYVVCAGCEGTGRRT